MMALRPLFARFHTCIFFTPLPAVDLHSDAFAPLSLSVYLFRIYISCKLFMVFGGLMWQSLDV